MKHSINHPVYGMISYEESVWTGKRSIQIGDTKLQKGPAKLTYLWNNGSETQLVIIKGNLFTGVTLTIGQDSVEVLKKTTWYEYTLSVLPLILILIWGNSVALCRIVPVVGGAIGGVIGGVAMVISVMQMRKRKLPGKILTALICTAAAFAVCALLGYLLVFALISAT